MAARTHFESLEETYEGLIPRKFSKSSMTVLFVIVVTIIVTTLLALIVFALHSITVLREDLNSADVQIDHGKNQLEVLSDRLYDAIEKVEFIANQSIVNGSGGSESLSAIEDTFKDYNRILKILSASAGRMSKMAGVPRPFLWAVKNTSLTFTCEADGKPLSSCLWTWPAKGQHRLVVIDEDGIVYHGGGAPEDGTFHVLAGLDSGKCTVQVEFDPTEHVDTWSCTLLSQAGEIYTGKVTVKEPVIYFTTAGDGVKSFAPKPPVVSTVTGNSHSLYGIAYDTAGNRLYWTSSFKIYRSEVGGTDVETLLNTQEYDEFRGLAYDWITSNIYAVTRGGFILACSDSRRSARTFGCGTVLSSQGDLRGIALNPHSMVMYWTEYYGNSSGSIMKAGMDGSGPVILVTGLREPCGITFDIDGARLYWADLLGKKIQSSNLDGGEVITITEVPVGPYGIALLDDRLYWSYWDSKVVQSSSKDGTEFQRIFEGTGSSRDFAVPTWNLPTKRPNFCSHRLCPNICVLSPKVFQCLD